MFTTRLLGPVSRLRRIPTLAVWLETPKEYVVKSSSRRILQNGAKHQNLRISIRHFSTGESEQKVEDKKLQASPKVLDLVEQITQLNLMEVAQLVQELKTQLNLPETSFQPAMMPATFAAAPTQGNQIIQRTSAAICANVFTFSIMYQTIWFCRC